MAESEAAGTEFLAEALGATRIAGLLAERTGHPVLAEDVYRLAELGMLPPAGSYKHWTLYSTSMALALDSALVGRLVAERVAWHAESLTRDEAVARIGWHWRDVARMTEQGRITAGRQGRYRIADIDRLAEEADGEQHITAQAAADVLEIRYPTDWRYVEEAGWVRPATTYERPVGAGRRTVTVSLYRLADVRAVRELPVDWESVRGLPTGAASPLREYAHPAPPRAVVVRRFAQRLANHHRVEVWAWYNPYTGRWELDWEHHEDGDGPSEANVRAALTADPEVATFRGEISLCPVWGRITREVRALLHPDAAVIIDTETTAIDGQAIEVAAIDAGTGKKLLDTLVKPTEPISAGARQVHGIADSDVADAPPFQQILPRLQQITEGRILCAYNADFDRGILLSDTKRAGKTPLHLEPWNRWYCLMEAYAAWIGSQRWLRLDGGHRALGDCQKARDVLVRMSKGRGTAFTPAPSPGDPVDGPPSHTVLAATALVPDA